MGLFSAGGIGSLLQGGASLMGMFGKNNPGRAAGSALAPIPEYGKQAYNPFIQQGQQAQQQLNPLYGQMTNNPQDYYNQLLSGYEPSAGYQHRQNNLNQTAHNAAAAGGYAGTGGDIEQRTQLINELMGGDIRQYLNDIMGIQGQGQKGLEGQVDRGFDASGALADYLGGAAGQQAGYNTFTRHQQNVNRNSGLSSLAELIGGGSFGGGASPFKSLSSIGGRG